MTTVTFHPRAQLLHLLSIKWTGAFSPPSVTYTLTKVVYERQLVHFGGLLWNLLLWGPTQNANPELPSGIEKIIAYIWSLIIYKSTQMSLIKHE